MSANALKWARDQKIADPTLVMTLRAVAWLADKSTDRCRKPQAAIAEEAGLKERAVRNALILLEQIGLIKRSRRSKGKYGRDIDEIELSIGLDFNVTRATVRAHRRVSRHTLQPAPNAAGTTSSNRHQMPLQPAPDAGEYNTVDTEIPYQEGELSTEVEGRGTASGKPTPHDEADAHRNVIQFPRRGAA